MSRYAYRKEYMWSDAIAYLVGLIASDGCLVNDGRHLNLTSTDIELINLTQQILEMQVIVKQKTSPYGSNAYNLQFSNVAFYDFLVTVGLTPAKSKTIGRLQIPDRYYPDFLRGYFDGDGTVYGYWDKRWRNSFMYYCSFASASHSFLSWLQASNTRLMGTGTGRIGRGTRVGSLTYAKNDSGLLHSKMYYKGDLPYLNRKYIKFNLFLDTDPYGKMSPDARVL